MLYRFRAATGVFKEGNGIGEEAVGLLPVLSGKGGRGGLCSSPRFSKQIFDEEKEAW